MIELTEQQQKALDGPDRHRHRPRTGRRYRLVPEIYGWWRAPWSPHARLDDPADNDLIRKDL